MVLCQSCNAGFDLTGSDVQRNYGLEVGAQVLPGLLEPDDLAAPYLWLASEGAKDMTGQALMLDRGEVMA